MTNPTHLALLKAVGAFLHHENLAGRTPSWGDALEHLDNSYADCMSTLKFPIPDNPDRVSLGSDFQQGQLVRPFFGLSETSQGLVAAILRDFAAAFLNDENKWGDLLVLVERGAVSLSLSEDAKTCSLKSNIPGIPFNHKIKLATLH